MDEPNSFGNPESPKDLKSVNDPLPTTDPSQQATVFQKSSDLHELAKESAPVANKVDEAVDSLSSELAAALPRRERMSRRTDLLAVALGMLVIASALLLGALVGWRLGWQNATLALRTNSPRYRATAPSKPRQIGHTLPVGNELRPSSAGTDECGQAGAAVPSIQLPSGGLTVCQEGHVIFRLPPSAPLPTRDLRTAQDSTGLQPDPQRR